MLRAYALVILGADSAYFWISFIGSDFAGSL